jgi:hypothetical protein
MKLYRIVGIKNNLSMRAFLPQLGIQGIVFTLVPELRHEIALEGAAVMDDVVGVSGANEIFK